MWWDYLLKHINPVRLDQLHLHQDLRTENMDGRDPRKDSGPDSLLPMQRQKKEGQKHKEISANDRTNSSQLDNHFYVNLKPSFTQMFTDFSTYNLLKSQQFPVFGAEKFLQFLKWPLEAGSKSESLLKDPPCNDQLPNDNFKAWYRKTLLVSFANFLIHGNFKLH